MKWKDLSLKERKQIYDSVRVNNPDATYLDIKQQFDSIPAYQDGKGKTINKADLPLEILMPLGGAGFVGHELNKE